MLALEYDSELERQAWLEEFEQSRLEGWAESFIEGSEKKALEIIKNLLKMRLSISDIIKATGWTEEQILKVADNNP